MNKYNKLLENIDIIYDDYGKKKPIRNDMTEGDHEGLHSHITKQKRILFDNAAINNKWETNHTFDALQKFYETGSFLFNYMCDYVFGSSVTKECKNVQLNRESMMLKVDEYEKKLKEMDQTIHSNRNKK